MRWSACHPQWILGFLDECWWSRLALPSLHSWVEAQKPLHLVEKSRDQQDPDPLALACYGLLRTDTGRVLLRFVEGRPISALTISFLEWVCQELAREGKGALLLVWDNASWHISQQVQGWLKEHNTRAKQAGGVRILTCRLPVKSPWLNPIEPHWVHAKRAIVEPEGKLTGQEIRQRVCDYFGCPCLDQITVAKEVA